MVSICIGLGCGYCLKRVMVWSGLWCEVGYGVEWILVWSGLWCGVGYGAGWVIC